MGRKAVEVRLLSGALPLSVARTRPVPQKRADGVEVHWEERGEGPTVFFAHISWLTTPSRFEALLTDLAADHRVLTWDPRGVGQSTRRGPS